MNIMYRRNAFILSLLLFLSLRWQKDIHPSDELNTAKIMVFPNYTKSFLEKDTFFCFLRKYILQHIRTKGKRKRNFKHQNLQER